MTDRGGKTMTEAPVTDLDLAEVEGLLEAATPGPWRWQVHLHGKQIELAGSGHSVMRFARWGMNGARPRLLSGGIMHDAEEFAAIVPGREHHARWFQTIDHPDANLIAAAPGIIRSLLSALKAERERAAQAWRPIETAPKDGANILLGWTGDEHIEQGLWRVDAQMWMGIASGFWKKKDWPTHWQPLPSPPGDRT